MNVKSVTSQLILPVEPKTRGEGSQEIKPQESADRDADGRRQNPDEEVRRNLSDEELQEAMEALKKLPGFSTNNLTVKLIVENEIRKVIIEDPQGQVVRRLSEAQLWAVTHQSDKATGQILAFHRHASDHIHL